MMRNQQAIQPLFELSHAGRRGARFPRCDVPERPLEQLLPPAHLAAGPLPLPEVTEPDVVRHFVNLSTLNMSVDTHFYPLGSCTMKYNPKRHERLARLPGIGDVHPHQREEDIQGLLAIFCELQDMLAEIAGLPAVSLQPAAGAQGEFTALLVAAAYFQDRGENRTKVLFPSSAHGTNPASAALAGFDCVQLPRTGNGLVDLKELQRHLDEQTAVFMITNPNTLGLFEPQIDRIASMLHDVGGLVYIDGANMNAILGITRPGDFGGDMMHYNVHKTFTGPHGAGGPGAGPIAVREFLADYLPGPVVVREAGAGGQRSGVSNQESGVAGEAADGGSIHHQPSTLNPSVRYRLHTPPKSIGRMRSFFGNVGILLRGYFYLRTLGAGGAKAVSQDAVLNANYLKAQLADLLPVPHGERCMHEFVASAKAIKSERDISAGDIAKRLLDFGFHAPTVYFPLDVPEALMIEPTETESRETLDRFADAVKAILQEEVDIVKEAPHTTIISRPDEVAAGRNLCLRWSGPA